MVTTLSFGNLIYTSWESGPILSTYIGLTDNKTIELPLFTQASTCTLIPCTCVYVNLLLLATVALKVEVEVIIICEWWNHKFKLTTKFGK